MCLVTFMKDVHPNYPLIFITNRDEQYDRAALPIHRWQDAPTVTGGIDLEALGTWLGYTNKGKFIAILNHPFTEWTPTQNPPRSRGQLLRDYLTEDISVSQFKENLRKTRKEYNGYHLIFGTFTDLNYYSNIEDRFETFGAGSHSISNTHDDLSNHRKDYSTQMLESYVKENKKDLKMDDLIKIMQNKEPSEILENYPKELDYELAKTGSAIFIEGEDFGTVGTTAILLDKKGNIKVKEVKYTQKKVTEKTTIEQTLDLD